MKEIDIKIIDKPIAGEPVDVVNDVVDAVGGVNHLPCILTAKAREVGHPSREVSMLDSVDRLNAMGEWKFAHRVELLRLHQFENESGDHPFETLSNVLFWATQAGNFRTKVEYQTGSVNTNYVVPEWHRYQSDEARYICIGSVDRYWRTCYDNMLIDIDDVRDFLLGNKLLAAQLMEDVRDGVKELMVMEMYDWLERLCNEEEVFSELSLQWRGFTRPTNRR